MTYKFDVLLVADPRFAGGTSAALALDCRTMSAAGLAVGLHFVRSRFFDAGGDRANETVLGLLDLEGVRAVPEGAAVEAGVAFFHNPQIFAAPFDGGVALDAERAVLVTHQPPFRGDGSLEYDPFAAMARIRWAFGAWPWWAPISELTRQHLRSFGRLLRLTTEDWTNLFDPADWRAGRAIFDASPPVVGRHGRADPLKWPEDPAAVNACLPRADGWRVRVLGCPVETLRMRGVDLGGWEILAFGAESPRAFLDSLDVFSYHTASTWTEAFGRTVVEAMLMERPAVLDPRLRTTFGDLARYAEPAQVRALLARLREDAEGERRRARAVREDCALRYGAAALPARLERLRRDAGVAGGDTAATPPLLTARRFAGLYWRRAKSLARATRRPA